ncbi:hypothetical protein [Sinorhizobium sp. BJ1]|uniref:hypothetical protein n=1 Tax=Sinorhizobium sp. BJ1 TaxID=2035455 RepID=UPI001FDFE431|nr:hypothetical protein [Sinorhizobium sp. BJ1]
MPHTLDRLQDQYGELLALCDAIESIADSIAGRVDRELFLSVAEKISSLRLAQTSELPRWDETGLWRCSPDIAEALRSAAMGRSAFSWQAIESMLRTLLEGLRLHVAKEQAMIEAMKRSKRPN